MARVSLDDFFRVITEVNLPNGKSVTVRTLSDWEVKERSKFCSLASSKTKQATSQKDSDDYLSYLAKYDTATREDNVSSLLILKRYEFITLRREQTRPEIIILPDEATPDERVDVEKRREEAHEKWQKDILEGSQIDVDAYEKTIEKMSDETIKREVKQAMADSLGQASFISAYEDYTIYYSTEINGKRFFKSPDAVRELPSSVREVLLEAYNNVSGVDPWAIEDFFETGI